MCGIFGSILEDNIDLCELIIKALNLLKNRGYDSVGVFLKNNEGDNFINKIGIDGDKIKNNEIKDIFKLLEISLKELEKEKKFNIGIGHTRWATHGGKTDENAHPHRSNNNKITLVHNGIISNNDIIKNKYLKNYKFVSGTDTEVIANMIQYLQEKYINELCKLEILKKLINLLEGTWACLIYFEDEPNKIYFIKNENPLLIGRKKGNVIFTSEPSGFMNMVDKYILLRDNSYGYFSNKSSDYVIIGDYKEIDLIRSDDNDIELPVQYKHWMRKEIEDQCLMKVLEDPILKKLRFNQEKILFNFDWMKSCKYLYIIGCGSSYYAGLIASNYFRFTKSFEFVNVFDGGEFTKAHLEAIENPEKDLLVILISQSGETRDLNIATTICREYSSNRKKKLIEDDPKEWIISDTSKMKEDKEKDYDGEIKILGIINVIGSLISRRTIDNIYTNSGRENSVASTKSCTSQILSCLLLAIYKAELENKIDKVLKNKFIGDLNKLENDIYATISAEKKIENIAKKILDTGHKNIFLLGKDELHGTALEGALKIKEVSYIHAEGFHITSLKHGPYALIEDKTPIIVLYKKKDHIAKSIIEELKTRKAYVIEISEFADNTEDNIILPNNRTMTGLLGVIVLQLLAYHLSILQGINPDLPKNLAKVVTVD